MKTGTKIYGVLYNPTIVRRSGAQFSEVYSGQALEPLGVTNNQLNKNEALRQSTHAAS